MSKRGVASIAISACAAAASFLGLAAAVGGGVPPPRAGVPPAPAYVPGELLVKFKPGVARWLKAQAIEGRGNIRIDELTPNGYLRVKLQSGIGVAEGAAAYTADPNIESAQPNYVYPFLALPNDPRFGQLWALKNTGQTIAGATYALNNPGVVGRDMDMETAWDYVEDCSSVIVAVVDSGVNYLHQDLAANMWDGTAAGFPKHGYDFVDDDDDPMPQDADGHGTHVAGTIGAVGNNGLGSTGVCWRAKLMAVRAAGAGGATTATLTQGVRFAMAHGARIINMSFGGPSFDPALDAEITSARTRGVIVVVAAGNEANDNDATSPVYPCNFRHDNLICVAALDQAYALAGFSNFGGASVDVGAPGVNALSSWPGTTVTDDFSSGWAMSGGFAAIACDLDGAGPRETVRMLADPARWCTPPFTFTYANNANDVAYKTFDLSAALRARLGYRYFLDTQPGVDFAGTAHRSTGGDPFGSGGLVEETSGTTGNVPASGSADLNDCLTTTCSVGFRLRSDGSVTDAGLALFAFQIDTVQPNSAAYTVLSGTSMATPYVAGVAALIWARNPDYTYGDVVNSVKNGGEAVAALAGRTTTGRAVNAMGSLRYINPPSGVAAVILPMETGQWGGEDGSER